MSYDAIFAELLPTNSLKSNNSVIELLELNRGISGWDVNTAIPKPEKNYISCGVLCDFGFGYVSVFSSVVLDGTPASKDSR